MASALHPKFIARSRAVAAAHKQLAATHPGWAAMTPQARIQAVHVHIDRPTLASTVASLHTAGAFHRTPGKP